MWIEYQRFINRWQRDGDSERLALATLFDEGFQCQEKDPDRSFALFSRGRDEAERLGEPWWVFFFESWRLSALNAYSMDFARALPLAMQLLVRINTPVARAHEWRNLIMINALYTYISSDAVGFRQEIERGFTCLEEEITNLGDRYVLNNRRIRFLSHIEQWKEAYDVAMRALALVEEDPSDRIWHGAWILYETCRICDALGEESLLADHSDYLAELSVQHPQLQRTRADANFWRAVVERRAGNEQKATRSFHAGMRILRGLERRDAICADAVARYHEVGGELRCALLVRERELVDIAKNGQLLRAAQVQVERCRLLAALNELTQADLTAARASAGKLRMPAWILSKLDRFCGE